MTVYREVHFELRGNRPVTPLFVALIADPSARARLQSLSIGPVVASVLVDYAGPPESVARLRRIVTDRAGPTTLLDYDTLIDDEKHVRFVATWTRPTKSSQGVSLEHLLYDESGPASLLFGRVSDGIISYKAAAPYGRGLTEFLKAAEKAFDGRFTVRALRAGAFRPGWEVDDRPARVQPEEEALLAAALAAGYYDEPKRCGVRELGDVLGLSKSVIARRLRSLERRALEQMVH